MGSEEVTWLDERQLWFVVGDGKGHRWGFVPEHDFSFLSGARLSMSEPRDACPEEPRRVELKHGLELDFAGPTGFGASTWLGLRSGAPAVVRTSSSSRYHASTSDWDEGILVWADTIGA